MQTSRSEQAITRPKVSCIRDAAAASISARPGRVSPNSYVLRGVVLYNRLQHVGDLKVVITLFTHTARLPAAVGPGRGPGAGAVPHCVRAACGTGAPRRRRQAPQARHATRPSA